MIEVANSVRELLVKERANLPEGIRLVTVFDSSPFALQMVEELEGNIITALVLVVAVLVAALGLRSSILVSLGVPFSMMSWLDCLPNRSIETLRASSATLTVVVQPS